MRRWLSAASAAAGDVADRPTLWLPGALAWTVSLGWMALVVGVARPPGVAELTFFGARAATSGLWPWNLVAAVAGVGLLLAAALGLAALGETRLVRPGEVVRGAVGRVFVVGAACAVPVVLAMVAVAVALPGVAQTEFNAADTDPGPLVRTVVGLAPLIAIVLVIAMAAGAVHAAAFRRAAAGHRAGEALRQSPGKLASAGAPALVHAVGLPIVRIGFLVLAAVLLRVLWHPIGTRLEGDGFGVAAILLLVGFVAIWLCLVLAGGALHAWGSVTWTRLLAVTEDGSAARQQQQMERRPGS
jgi:hypothetical protein